MPIHRFKQEFNWNGIPVLPYKENTSNFKAITRQTLFGGSPDLRCEVRYFEIAAGGHSTLERHEHEHVVIIQRGSGSVLVGNEVNDYAAFDVIIIPPHTWHQFRATRSEPLGFICIVSTQRDRPQRPDSEELRELKSDEVVARFIRT